MKPNIVSTDAIETCVSPYLLQKQTLLDNLRRLFKAHNINLYDIERIFPELNYQVLTDVSLLYPILTYEYLLTIANYFTVSVSWLTGESEKPYYTHYHTWYTNPICPIDVAMKRTQTDNCKIKDLVFVVNFEIDERLSSDKPREQLIGLLIRYSHMHKDYRHDSYLISSDHYWCDKSVKENVDSILMYCSDNDISTLVGHVENEKFSDFFMGKSFATEIGVDFVNVGRYLLSKQRG